MKKEDKKVAKLAKKAKVDSKKVIITDEVSENYMRSKIEKKRGRPKKVSEDLNSLNYNPKLAELKRITKTMKRATVEDVQRFVGKQIEMSYPILEQVIGKEYFSDLMQNPKAKEILSSENVKTLIAEMIKEYTNFTIDVLSAISDAKFSVSDLNKNGEVLDRVNQLKDKYNPKLVSEIELYRSSIQSKEKANPLRETNEFITIRKEHIQQFLKMNKPEQEKQQKLKSKAKQLAEENEKTIVIRLKNRTDEKLRSVAVFDHLEHWAGQVEHTALLTQFPFKEFLRKMGSIQAGQWKIVTIRCHAKSEFNKFAEIQTDSGFQATYSNLWGQITSFSLKPEHLKDRDARVHKNIADIYLEDGISLDSDLQLEIDFLMPETEVSITFLVEKIDKQ